MPDSGDWRVRKGTTLRRFADRLVLQGIRPGQLDLSVCLLAGSPTSKARLGLLAPLAAACTSEGIRRDTGIVSWLHWPNLVTIDDRVVAKTSLSLTGTGEPGVKTQVVIDISVNCSSARQGSFPPSLPSTSILEVMGVEIDLPFLRDKILHAVNWYFAEWERGMNRKLVERMEPTISWIGHEVEISAFDGPPLLGAAKGLDDFGSLLLEQRGKEGRKRTRAVRPESASLVRVVP